jgi:hypothetical protein
MTRPNKANPKMSPAAATTAPTASGGAIPLPLTVMQLLAIDLGTDTLPALALSREPAERGLMERPPRPKAEGLIRPALLVRAWRFLGLISAVLVLSGFFVVLHDGGWHLHAATGTGTPLHHLYQQATTITWLGIVACQIGTAFAARTDKVSLRSIGLTTNPLLLGGIAAELVFAAALIYLPFLHPIFGTAALSLAQVAVVLPYPFVVWGADETLRWAQRHKSSDDPGLIPVSGDDLSVETATPKPTWTAILQCPGCDPLRPPRPTSATASAETGSLACRASPTRPTPTDKSEGGTARTPNHVGYGPAFDP